MHFKATPLINDICRQLAKELKAIKDALERALSIYTIPWLTSM
jgi:hypothetical protein